MISTYINGIKHYIRRYREGIYNITVTMVTTNELKALHFTKYRLNKIKNKLPIGYKIEKNG